MRIVGWNIHFGGGDRKAEIAAAASAFDADVLVLSEYTTARNPAIDLRRLLSERGYVGWVDSGPVGGYLGVAIASRTPLDDLDVPDPVPPWAGLTGALIGGLDIVGVYSPGSASHVGDGRSIKGRWWDALVDNAERWRDRPCVIIGDFNNGIRGLDELGRTFASSDRFAALTDHGFRDAWRDCHGPTAQEWSWWSNRGSPYRLDHCFVTGNVTVVSASYECRSGPHLLVKRPDESSVLTPLSDHAALVVDLETVQSTPLAT